MKQKIVINVQMNCKKCRSKALQIAAVADGVEFVGLEGADKDQVVVIGERVDSVGLASCLRKKVGHASIISVGEVKPEEKKKEEEKKEEAEKKDQAIQNYMQYPGYGSFVLIDGDPRPGNCCQM